MNIRRSNDMGRHAPRRRGNHGGIERSPEEDVMPGEWFIIVLLLNLLGILNGVWGKSRIEAFLAAVPAITIPRELQEFKRMVKQQMYLALVQLFLLGGALLLMIYGILTGRLSLLEVVLLGLVNVFIFLMAYRFKRIEQRAASLAVENPDLLAEYQRVCIVWRRKPLPDW
jgi:hypothetical protein